MNNNHVTCSLETLTKPQQRVEIAPRNWTRKMRISQGPYNTTAATQPQKQLDWNRSKCNKLTTRRHNARTRGKLKSHKMHSPTDSHSVYGHGQRTWKGYLPYRRPISINPLPISTSPLSYHATHLQATIRSSVRQCPWDTIARVTDFFAGQ